METSAKDGNNIEKLFVEIGKILYRDYMKYKKKQKKPNEKVKLEKNVIKQEKKGGCCGK